MDSCTVLLIFSIFLFFTANSERLTISDVRGSKLGDQKPGISSVKRYLKHYGYLLTESETIHDDNFDEPLRSAIEQYQTFFRLNVTGVLDEPTVELLSLPRCGVADHHHPSTNTTGAGGARGRSLYVYFPGKPVWPPDRRSLKFSFRSDDTTFPAPDLSAVFQRAFSRWQAVTNIDFTLVDMDQSPDIVLRFFLGDHEDGYPFDGGLGMLAHATPPVLGNIHFDASEFWTESPNDEASSLLGTNMFTVDLESVTVHEIGHVLGLAHSPDPMSIMFPSLSPQTRKVKLTVDDVVGIQNLYGARG